MSEAEQKKRAVYAERSRLKRQEHLVARSPEADDPIVPYLFSRTFQGTEYLCPKLETEFYKLHGFLNRYLKLTQDGKDCRSPCAEEGGFQVVAKVNIAFDTILCYAVGKIRIYDIGEDEPASHAPHYVFGTLHIDTTDCPYDAGYWTFNRSHKDDPHRFELNYARYIASVQPGDPAINCFIEAVPLLWMFRIRALKPIYAGDKVLIGTAIPKRYCVTKGAVLDYYEDSLSENMRLKSRGIPSTYKREKKRKGADPETVDLTL
jgi:hypothetical protein